MCIGRPSVESHLSFVIIHALLLVYGHRYKDVMTRSLQTLLSIPKRAVVRLAYHVVALLVTCARWIAHQWKYRVVHTSRGWLWYRRRSRGGKGVGYAKGQRPKDPRVLGVVLFQRSFRAQEDQALSRLLVWCVLYFGTSIQKRCQHVLCIIRRLVLQGCTTRFYIVYSLLSV